MTRVKAGSPGPIILIVDDDEELVLLVRHFLARAGFRVGVAKDGIEAMALMDKRKPPAAVVLDVLLPRADGFEVLRTIRRHPKWCRVPIVMLTASAGEEETVRALRSGANDFIAKPFQPRELVARIERLVRANSGP